MLEFELPAVVNPEFILQSASACFQLLLLCGSGTAWMTETCVLR